MHKTINPCRYSYTHNGNVLDLKHAWSYLKYLKIVHRKQGCVKWFAYNIAVLGWEVVGLQTCDSTFSYPNKA
jgi:hypothetical protein